MSHRFLIDFFDYQKPSPTEIRRRYNVVDLSGYSQLTWENIIYAIINCKPNQAIVIPEEYGIMLLEVQGHPIQGYKQPWLIHWLYAPDVMLNTTAMTVEEARSFRLNQAVKEASWDYNMPHRGFGVIDPRTHIEILWPFLYLVEGLKLAYIGKGLIRVKTKKGADITGEVPSLSEEKMHTTTLRNVYSYPSIFTHVYSDCTCLWPRYGMRRREEKYKGGERIMCRHGIALAEEIGIEGLPSLTGILNPWFTLKQRTIIGNKKITKTQMNALLGMIIAYMKENNYSAFKF